MMRRLVLNYWWILPILLLVCVLGLFFLFLLCSLSILEDVLAILIVLILICLPFSWVILLINKKWWQCLLSFLISIVIIALLWYPLVLSAMSGPDDFGENHPIPEGLEYHLPHTSNIFIDREVELDNDVFVDSLDMDTYLQVWGECGIYTYDFYYYGLPSGEVFLRCYDVTEDIPLSVTKILERSSVYVDSTYSFSKLVSQKEFTIYEGDWEDYYAARIEVWFRDAHTMEEKKLVEKTYRVEGWMR